MKNNVRILIALMLAFSCSTAATNMDKLEAFLTQNNRNIEDYDVVMRISETGCVGCNKSFASLVKNYVKSRNNLFIISAKGGSVDISPYLENEDAENILFDFGNKFESLKIIENSGILFLKDNKIDTLINIQAKGIEETLRLIDAKLK